MGIEKLDQLGEVSKRSRQPIYLIDDDNVRSCGRGCRPAVSAGRAGLSSARSAPTCFIRMPMPRSRAQSHAERKPRRIKPPSVNAALHKDPKVIRCCLN